MRVCMDVGVTQQKKTVHRNKIFLYPKKPLIFPHSCPIYNRIVILRCLHPPPQNV